SQAHPSILKDVLAALPANLLWPPGTLIHPRRSPASLIQTALFAPTVSARVCHGKIRFPAHKTPFERKQKRLSQKLVLQEPLWNSSGAFSVHPLHHLP